MKHTALLAPVVLLACSCCAMTPAALADTFYLTASGSGITVDATLYGTPDTQAGAFDIQSGSGTINGTPISLVTPSGTTSSIQLYTFHNPINGYTGPYYYDNVVYFSGNSNGLQLDAYGLLFSDSTDDLNLFAQGAYSFSNDETMNNFSAPLDSLSITPVAATPEPAAIALFGTGLLGLAGAHRRRRAV